METNGLIAIEVNGAPERVAARTLSEAVAALGHHPSGIATAVNGLFVAAANRATFILVDGDRVEIVGARQGG